MSINQRRWVRVERRGEVGDEGGGTLI